MMSSIIYDVVHSVGSDGSDGGSGSPVVLVESDLDLKTSSGNSVVIGNVFDLSDIVIGDDVQCRFDFEVISGEAVFFLEGAEPIMITAPIFSDIYINNGTVNIWGTEINKSFSFKSFVITKVGDGVVRVRISETWSNESIGTVNQWSLSGSNCARISNLGLDAPTLPAKEVPIAFLSDLGIQHDKSFSVSFYFKNNSRKVDILHNTVMSACSDTIDDFDFFSIYFAGYYIRVYMNNEGSHSSFSFPIDIEYHDLGHVEGVQYGVDLNVSNIEGIFVFVYDYSSLEAKMYYNGVLLGVHSITESAVAAMTDRMLCLGRSKPQTPWYGVSDFNIANLGFWSRALVPDEVMQIGLQYIVPASPLLFIPFSERRFIPEDGYFYHSDFKILGRLEDMGGMGIQVNKPFTILIEFNPTFEISSHVYSVFQSNGLCITSLSGGTNIAVLFEDCNDIYDHSKFLICQAYEVRDGFNDKNVVVQNNLNRLCITYSGSINDDSVSIYLNGKEYEVEYYGEKRDEITLLTGNVLLREYVGYFYNLVVYDKVLSSVDIDLFMNGGLPDSSFYHLPVSTVASTIESSLGPIVTMGQGIKANSGVLDTGVKCVSEGRVELIFQYKHDSQADHVFSSFQATSDGKGRRFYLAQSQDADKGCYLCIGHGTAYHIKGINEDDIVYLSIEYSAVNVNVCRRIYRDEKWYPLEHIIKDKPLFGDVPDENLFLMAAQAGNGFDRQLPGVLVYFRYVSGSEILFSYAHCMDYSFGENIETLFVPAIMGIKPVYATGSLAYPSRSRLFHKHIYFNGTNSYINTGVIMPSRGEMELIVMNYDDGNDRIFAGVAYNGRCYLSINSSGRLSAGFGDLSFHYCYSDYKLKDFVPYHLKLIWNDSKINIFVKELTLNFVHYGKWEHVLVDYGWVGAIPQEDPLYLGCCNNRTIINGHKKYWLYYFVVKDSDSGSKLYEYTGDDNYVASSSSVSIKMGYPMVDDDVPVNFNPFSLTDFEVVKTDGKAHTKDVITYNNEKAFWRVEGTAFGTTNYGYVASQMLASKNKIDVTNIETIRLFVRFIGGGGGSSYQDVCFVCVCADDSKTSYYANNNVISLHNYTERYLLCETSLRQFQGMKHIKFGFSTSGTGPGGLNRYINLEIYSIELGYPTSERVYDIQYGSSSTVHNNLYKGCREVFPNTHVPPMIPVNAGVSCDGLELSSQPWDKGVSLNGTETIWSLDNGS